jgi:hypothetical protein
MFNFIILNNSLRYSEVGMQEASIVAGILLCVMFAIYIITSSPRKKK